MPRFVRETEITLDWTDMSARPHLDHRVLKQRQGSMVRSSGVHLSGVIRYALQKAGLAKFEDREDEMPLMVALGMFWEEGIVTLYPDLVWQPGEAMLDNIFGSPDGITFVDSHPDGLTAIDPRTPMLEEFKLTKKTYRTRAGSQILGETLWMWQLMGYLHMLGLTLCRLHVCWVDGDYRERRMPIYSTFYLEFTKLELERFWANVVLKNMAGAAAEVH